MSSTMQDGVFSVPKFKIPRYYRVSEGKRTIYDRRLKLCLCEGTVPFLSPVSPSTFCLPKEFVS